MARQFTLDQAEAAAAACQRAGGAGVSADTVDEDDQVACAGAAAYSG